MMYSLLVFLTTWLKESIKRSWPGQVGSFIQYSGGVPSVDYLLFSFLDIVWCIHSVPATLGNSLARS